MESIKIAPVRRHASLPRRRDSARCAKAAFDVMLMEPTRATSQGLISTEDAP